MNVLTRSFDIARTGTNTNETALTPQNVGSNLLVKQFSLQVNDDPRIEAQPLYVEGVQTPLGIRNVLYICTMANNVWAFDAGNGQPVWNRPVNLGTPVKPNGDEIDMFGINILWGILSTPVIDDEAGRMYVVCWTSPDGSVANAVHRLHALDITTGAAAHPPLEIAADATAQGKPQVRFLSSHQKQRAALLLTRMRDGAGQMRKTLFVGCAMTHEEHDPSHGWLIAYDVDQFRQTAAWCTTPNGSGSGIWHAGQGPAAGEDGAIYVMTGNYGVEDQNGNTVRPPAGDLPDSFVKLQYTPPADAQGAGKLEAVAWFTPFFDADRPRDGDDDFQDYDLGSAGPLSLPGMGLVVGAGKDGVAYVLDQDTNRFGKGSDYSVLRQPPVFFTYFPGFGIDAAQIQNLNHLFDGKTHHLHTSPIFWRSPAHGPMLFCWGENESLRAWTVAADGTISFVAKGAEIASAGVAGKGGMPGGMLALSANGAQPNTGIVWALAPISGDANKHVVEGILRAYDATKLDPVPNADGSPRLKLLWDSLHIPNNHFSHCKFCPPVIAGGRVFVPTYDGRVDVYGLIRRTRAGPVPTNAKRVDTPGLLPGQQGAGA
jgi:outer membrane protein assembly factor BamB